MASSTYDGKEFIVSSWGSYSSTMTCTWQLLSQSISANTSTIRLRHYFYCGTNKTSGSGYSYYVCDGQTTTWNGYTMYNGYTLIQTKDITVTHNSDGTFPGRTVSISASGYSAVAGCSGSGTITGIATIPRQASISSAPNFNDEENPTIKYSNPAGNSVSSLQACISLAGTTDDIKYRNISKTGSSYTFELTDDERKLLLSNTTTATSRTVKFYVKTIISGTTYYSNVSKTFSVINANPEFSDFSWSVVNDKSNSLTGDNKTIINGYSDVELVVSTENIAKAKKEATISKYRGAIGTKTLDFSYSDSEETKATISGVDSSTINVYAIDSRSNSTLISKQSAGFINYSELIKGNISAERTENGVGEEITLSYDGTIDSVNFGSVTNSIKKAYYTIRRLDSDEIITGESDITPKISDNSFSFEGLIKGDTDEKGFDIGSSYVITVYVQDELSIVQFETNVISGRPNLAIAKNGVAIMGKYDDDLGGYLQVGKKLFQDAITETGTNYIKFSNGYAIAWGSQKKTGTYDLPITFKSVFVGFSTPRNSQSTSAHFSQLAFSTSTVTIVNFWATTGGTINTDGSVGSDYVVIGLV
jgi:hypothetical protein